MADRAEGSTGWSWFADPAPAGLTDDTAAAFARCFAGPDGIRVLAALRAMTLDRALGPEASEATLRHLEGQRRLVAIIHALAVRGRGGAPSC